MINTILQSSTLLLTCFVIFDVVNTLNLECRSNNQNEHNMVPYFQLISCLELFPSIPNTYYRWPNLFVKFSNTHFHVLDVFVSSKHNLSLPCQSYHHVSLGISRATPIGNKKWFKVDHGIYKLLMLENQLVQCTNLHAK